MADTLTFTLDTGDGEARDVVIKLRPDLAPGHVERITELASEGFYDGVVFHRVIAGFMAQVGCPKGTGTGGSSKPDIKAEFNAEPHVRGVVSMVLCEYVDPPPCLSCAGTASTWRMVDGAVKAIDCPACGGSGRRRATDDELTQISGLPAGKWAPRYAALHRLLRTHERAALSTMREALSEVPAGA